MFVESRRIDAVLSVRNEKTQLTIFGGKPFLRKMSCVLAASMWSKKPEMSKRMRAP